MARHSKFSREQDAHIATYLLELEKIHDQVWVAIWTDRAVHEIMQSPLFEGKLLTVQEDPERGGSPAEWYQVCLTLD